MKKKTKIILSTLLILVGLGLLGTAGWLWYDANVTAAAGSCWRMGATATGISMGKASPAG